MLCQVSQDNWQTASKLNDNAKKLNVKTVNIYFLDVLGNYVIVNNAVNVINIFILNFKNNVIVFFCVILFPCMQAKNNFPKTYGLAWPVSHGIIPMLKL